MFNKGLFLSLCGKYDVELSDTLARPMIKVESELHDITNCDINRVLVPKQTYFSNYGKLFSNRRNSKGCSENLTIDQ